MRQWCYGFASRAWWSLAFALLLFSTSPAFAVLVTVSENPADFGHLNQRAIGVCNGDPTDLSKDRSNGCGPVAAVNSFVFLQKTYPGIYDNKLVANTPNGPRDAAAALATDMECNCDLGTASRKFLAGKAAYINREAPNTTRIEFQNVFSTPSVTPTLAFLVDQLKAKQDVELLFGYYTKNADGTFTQTGAHYVTLTSASFNDMNGNGRVDPGDTPDSIAIIDQWGVDTTTINGALELPATVTTMMANIGTVASPNTRNFLYLTNYFGNANELNGNSNGIYRDAASGGNTYVFVQMAAAESPIPEPSSLAVLAISLGLLGVCVMRCRAADSGRAPTPGTSRNKGRWRVGFVPRSNALPYPFLAYRTVGERVC